MDKAVLGAPDPHAGWSREIVELSDAVVVPPRTARMRQAAGVFGADGTYCHEAGVWRHGTAMLLEPKLTNLPETVLPGHWLWAGSLFDHFGHFLIESLSRLWAAHSSGLQLNGIIYIPKRWRRGPDLLPFQQQILEAWGLNLPVHVALGPLRVERLVVPGQGFGLGAVVTGTPEMRDAVYHHFGRDIRPEGPERLYVSRSRLDASAGSVLIEPDFEVALSSEGYEIFHPQDHDIATQIARYKAARKVVLCDGSAAHLFANVGRPDQQVAFLLRRSIWSDGIVDHIRAFSGIEPHLLPLPIREWIPKDTKAQRGVSLALHDLGELGRSLAQTGFVEGNRWPASSPRKIEMRIAEHLTRGGFSEVSG